MRRGLPAFAASVLRYHRPGQILEPAGKRRVEIGECHHLGVVGLLKRA